MLCTYIYMIMNKLLVNISRGFLKMLSLFPLRFHYFMGGILSWLIGKVGKYRYSVVLVNLSRSFPQKKYGEIKRIARDFYRHLGDIIAETIWFSGSSHTWPFRRRRRLTVASSPSRASITSSTPACLSFLNKKIPCKWVAVRGAVETRLLFSCSRAKKVL